LIDYNSKKLEILFRSRRPKFNFKARAPVVLTDTSSVMVSQSKGQATESQRGEEQAELTYRARGKINDWRVSSDTALHNPKFIYND